MVDRLKHNEYSLRYYRNNKEKINEKRRQKYREQKEIREWIKERNRTRYARKEKEDEKRNKQRRVRERKKAITKWYRVEIAGSYIPIRMYSLRQVAKRLNKTYVTIRKWLDDGHFPDAMYKHKNMRLFTYFQIEEVMKVYYEIEDRKGKKVVANRLHSTDFFDRVKEIWKKYPIGINEEECDGY